jgi:type IV secretory pathway VirD2 relaxase
VKRDDDDRFVPRPGAPKAGGSGSGKRFVSRVLRAAQRAGGAPGVHARRTSGGRKARGFVAARFAGGVHGTRARRVVVKTRLVNLSKAGLRSLQKHLRYIERDGVGPTGEPGCAYGRDADIADLEKFDERAASDRHQFRLIVAPEDAAEIGDLRAFTRQLMAQMERDLGTRLEWVAVDHWDTDNPHTHIVLRGRDGQGRDLVIDREYIAYGMRARASELATEWLGIRTEREIVQSRKHEVEQERWTGLDRDLRASVRAGVVVLPQHAEGRNIVLGRLQHLARMGLASQQRRGEWTLHSGFEATLRALGERGDIVRSMQRAMSGAPREFAIHDPATQQRDVNLVGRIAGKGLADELHDRGYLVVDGLDGKAHYIPLPTKSDLADFAVGAIVEVRSGARTRRIDESIAANTHEGLYWINPRRADHTGAEDAHVAHTRRLEALRHAGHVERVRDGVWRIPSDYLARARDHDRKEHGDLLVDVRSAFPIERQVRAVGASWLDQQLVAGGTAIAAQGFGAEVRCALRERSDFLVGQGLAERRGQRLVLMRNLLATLRAREIEATSQSIEKETGLKLRAAVDGTRVQGTYRRSLWLASGRFAMLEDGHNFSLVPWRPVIEHRLGQTLAGTVRDDRVSWDFSRERGRTIE